MSRYSHKGKTFIGLKKSQDVNLLKLGSLLDKDTLPNTIPELQDILHPLLNNIFVDGPFSQLPTEFNIADTTKGYDNIYTIPELQENLDVVKYKAFLTFMIQKLYENNTGYSQNTPDGEIITAYCSDDNEEDKTAIENIKKRYEELYLSKNKEYVKQYKDNYPFWTENLLSKSRTVLYDETEPTIGTTNITELTDAAFLELLKKRVDALNTCRTDSKSTDEQKEYYSNEYEIENNILKDYQTNKNNSETSLDYDKRNKHKIAEICSSIKWGSKPYKYNRDKEFNFNEFNNFVKNNPNEINYLKTFLPEDCFDKNDELIEDKIQELFDTNDRIHRQYIFGFGENVFDYSKYKQFYEIYNKEFSQNHFCNNLVNFTLLLNTIYNRCSISNDKVVFPVRFILPSHERNIYKPKKEKSNTTYYDIKKPKKITDLFNKDSTFVFKGFINIKFFHTETKQFRNWILFIFLNTNDNNDSIINDLTGQIPKYILINYTFDRVNNGLLTGKFSVTYSELKDFIIKKSKNKLLIYTSILDNKVLFIRPYPLLTKTEMELSKVKLSDITFQKIEELSKTLFKHTIEQSGGKKILNINNINIKTSNTITLLDSINDTINGKDTKNTSFDTFIKSKLSNIFINTEFINIFNKTLEYYKYLLVSSNEIIFLKLLNKDYYNKFLITKYHPLYYKYYKYNEIFINFNIFNTINKNDNILNVDTDLSILELITNYNYKIKNIKCILYFSKDFKIDDEKLNYINIFKSLYHNLDIVYFRDTIYKLLNFNDTSKNNYKLFLYKNYIVDIKFWMHHYFYNTINLYIGMMMNFKYTQIGGTFIITLGNVGYKPIADIYLILKKYFEKSHLYYPEISNHYKDADVMGVFQNFIGISKDEYNTFLNILNKLMKQYPDNLINNFNVYNKEERDKLHITTPIDTGKRDKYIIGFLPDDTDYSEIIDFNNSIYPQKLLFIEKMLMNFTTPTTIKIPTQDQIVSSTLYCRKYDIPIFDKYSITSQNSIITKTILHDMYGLHESIMYKFKTPFKTHITGKIVFNPKFKSLSRQKSLSRKKSKSKSKSKSSFHKTKKTKSLSFFNNLFTNDNSNTSLKSKSHKKTKKHGSKYNIKKTKSHKLLSNTTMSLEDAITYSNNSLIQVGRLMDVRKDFFTTDDPNKLYYMLKEQFRYYKATTPRPVQNLDKQVQSMLKDYSISQAWLKMYEIITDCDLIPTNRKGTYKSFHICEAPGTFINCINNYIHTKTHYDTYEWKSQSLKPKGAMSKATTIGDTYGLIKRYPDKWDFGVDDTGDITNIENIKYYAKMAKDMNINLMTSDCGLPMGDTKYYQVAYASYVSLLYSLPQNGTLLYKVLSPIDVPLIWNLIYITYTNFKEMYFFKPVQNSQSREFYIIGKGYLGTEQSVLDKLLSLIPKFEESTTKFNKEEYDLFNDTYPEEFVIQVQNICDRLAANYVNSIERIIYYVDNIDALGKDYKKHIESYMKEKNEDWIRKYKVMKLDKQFIL